ncbi:uncharacterized protein LOC129873803 [Solanum dulcamara]|uniref:uncharacterized protein LOC129873803 n=1 Tax=Solanum dulcamara TaxID=45834 RepID=UPI0024862C71|nr:uncharacterized protein LOC129873803 [Solanum dulcamara]
MEAWNHLRDIFQDNKHSCAVTLDYDFTHVDMTDFSNVFAYCQHLKYLADQLKNVGSPVANDPLVLQLVSGLTEPYQARLMLTLEDAGHVKKAAQSSSATLFARSSEGLPDVPHNFSSNRNPNSGKRNHNQRNNGEKYRGNNGSRGGSKRAANSGGNAGHSGHLGGSNSRSTGQQSAGQNPPPYSP